MPRNDSVGPAFVAFRGVVVHHVQDHLDAGIVQARHHFLELGKHESGDRGIARIGGEEADRVVAPVVGQSLVQQIAVVDEGVDRQQFDRRDAERPDVVHDFLAAQTGEGAAQRLRHRGMQLGEAADVGFVNDRAVPGDARRAFAAPREGGIDHPAFRHEGRAIALVEGQVFASWHRWCSRNRRGPSAIRRHAPWHRDRAPACWD